MIEWLKRQSSLPLSQFTVDWLERTIDDYETMAEDDVLPPETEIQGALKYQIENILEVIKPDLPDVVFFNSLLQEMET